VDLVQHNGDLQLLSLGPDPLFFVEGVVTYGMAGTDMPAALRCRCDLRRIGRDLAVSLAFAFERGSALRSEERSAIVVAAEQWAGGVWGR
jgi:hypothetical protein